MSAPGAPANPTDLRTARRRVVDLARMAAAAYERPDLASALATALVRIDRPQTLVAFVGDYKKGKSSVVNALLGEDVVPVSDDRATAVLTVVMHAESRSAAVTSVVGDGRVRAVAEWDDALGQIVERVGGRAADAALDAALVELGVPSDVLETGITFLDTPGAGAMSVSDSLVSPALLRAVDAIVFVTDASAPFLRSELDALVRVAAVTPATVVVLNKVDLYPEWQRIARTDESAIATANLSAPVLPVSSSLWAAAIARDDERLLERSGIPGLRQLLMDVAVDPTRAEAARRGLEEAVDAVEHIQEINVAELSALGSMDEGGADAATAESDAARERLRHLRGSGGKWGQVLNEALSDGFAETEHVYRSALRNVQREFEERVEKMDPARDWEDLTTWAREEAGRINEQLFAKMDEAARSAEQRVADWLREEDVAGMGAGTTDDGSIRSVDIERDLDEPTRERPGVKKAASLMFSGLRGGQGGILTIGMLASLV
ncbi:MAG: dynamin family protein, partial [Candidatus Limnocylindrales bacterium]